MIRVRAFGAGEIAIGRRRITPSGEFTFALGLYLCVRAGERLPRDRVAELFWGNARERQGRHSLRQLLYKLRQRGLTLDEDGDVLYLAPARVTCDVTAALAPDWVERATADEVLAAGTVAAALVREVSQGFHEWLDGVRGQVAAQHRRASLRQIALARREGRWSDLDKWAQQVLRSDPLNEEATLARAESAAMAGSKAMALEIIDQYLEDLGDRSVQIGLPATVLRKRIAERRVEWGGKELPLVGRHDLTSRLQDLVARAAKGHGSLVVLVGAAGIGKSRLAIETARFAELNGFRVVTHRSAPNSLSRPLMTMMALGRSLLELPGAAGCDPLTRQLFSADSVPQAVGFRTEIATRDFHLTELHAALADLIDAVSSEVRLAIVLDDLQHLDAPSWELLNALNQQLGVHRALLLGTTRYRSDYGISVNDGVAPLHFVRVPPLSESASLELTLDVLRAQRKYDTDTAYVIAKRSGGVPFFIQELVAQSPGSSHAPLRHSRLEDLVLDRLETLPPMEDELLQFISVLGAPCTLAHLRHLLGQRAHTLPTLLRTLEAEGIISLGTNKTVELHDLWHDGVQALIPAASRAALSYECAEAVLECTDTPTTPETLWRAAQLLSAAGASVRAAQHLLEAADALIERGLLRAALPALVEGDSLAVGASLRLSILLRLAQVHFATDSLDDCIAICVIGSALEAPDLDEMRSSKALLAALHTESLAKQHHVYADGMHALASYARDRRVSPAARHYVCMTAIRLLANDAPSDRDRDFLRWSDEASQVSGPSVNSYLVAMIFHAERGERDKLAIVLDLLASDDLKPRAPQEIARLLRYRGTGYRFLGDASTAATLLEQSYEHSIQHSLFAHAALAAEARVFHALDWNDTALAQDWLGRWLDASPSTAYKERSQSLVHARSRLLFQQGNYDGALECYAPRLPEIAADSLPKRQAPDIATLAVLAAHTGNLELFEWATANSLNVLATHHATRQFDYVAEAILRAAKAARSPTLQASLRHAYATKRATLDIPLADFFSELTIMLHSTPKTPYKAN